MTQAVQHFITQTIQNGLTLQKGDRAEQKFQSHEQQNGQQVDVQQKTRTAQGSQPAEQSTKHGECAQD